MWTYRNEVSSVPSGQNARVPINSERINSTAATAKEKFSESVTAAEKPHHFTRVAARTKKRFGFVPAGAFLYLCGILLGSLWHPGEDAWLYGYAQHYVTSQIVRVLEHQTGLIFCAQFLALIVQLVLATLAGFCAFGVVVLPLLVLLKGIGAGFFVSFLYLEYGIVKGVCMELLFFLLPQLLGLFLLIIQCAAAWKLSRELLAVCTHNRGIRSTTESKRVLNRFLICSASALIPCALSCALAVLFSGLFLT